MFCYKCGASIAPGSKFCAGCGAAVQVDDVPAQAESAPVAPIKEENAPEQVSEAPVKEDGVSEQAADASVQEDSAPEQTSEASAQVDSAPEQTSDAPAQEEAFPNAQQYQPDVQTDGQPSQPDYQSDGQPSRPDYQSDGQPFQPDLQSDGQQPQPVNQPYSPFQPPPPPTKEGKSGKGLWLKIGIPVVCAIALIAVGLFFFVFNSSPLNTVAKSLSKVGNELEQRVSDTPLESIGILMESLESGTVSVDFDYSAAMTNMRGNVSLHSDEKRGESVIEANIASDIMNFDIVNFDIDLYINKERAAMRMSQIDNNFYGITYETFREDFRSFANLLDLSRDEIDMICDVVEMYSDMLNMEDDEVLDGYQDIFTDFIKSAEVSSERVDIKSGNESVRVRKIEFTITDRMIVELLESLVDEFENDDNMRAMFEANEEIQSGLYMGFGSYMSFDDMIREIRSGLRELDRNLRGEVLVAFYIGGGDRLVRLDINADLEYDREKGDLEITLDFGSSADDLWVFEMNTHDDSGRSSYRLEWEMNETSRGGETVLRASSDDSWSSSETSFILDWTDRGNFTFSLDGDWGREMLFSGVYDKNNDGFSLVIDDPFADSFWNQSLVLEISATRRSGHIDDISFINVSEWNQSLIDKIEDYFSFGGLFASAPVPVPPIDEPELPEPPAPPVDDVNPDLANSFLIGEWEFTDGVGTYFFWSSSNVEFTSDGVVFSSDSGYGTWNIEGDRLTVVDSFGTTFQYTVEIADDSLYIIDSDGDMGRFDRIL